MAKQSFPNIKKVHQSVFPNVVFGSSENMSMKSDLFTFGSLRWPPIILCVYQSSVACFEGDSQRRQFVGKIKKYFWKNLNLPSSTPQKECWKEMTVSMRATTIQSIFLTTMHSSTSLRIVITQTDRALIWTLRSACHKQDWESLIFVSVFVEL